MRKYLFIAFLFPAICFSDPDCGYYDLTKHDFRNQQDQICQKYIADIEAQSIKNELTTLINQYSKSYSGKYQERMVKLEAMIKNYELSWQSTAEKGCDLSLYNETGTIISQAHTECISEERDKATKIYKQILSECKASPPTEHGRPCLGY